MGFLNRLFSRTATDKEIWSAFFDHLVFGYRQHAAVHRCAPGPGVSDAEIVEVYKRVEGAFQEVARARGSPLPPDIIQNIVLFFLQQYQMFGQAHPAFFTEHLDYETEKFKREGLRTDYNRPLSLILEEPRWHTQIPTALQFPDSVLVSRLELVRCELGLDEETFLVAVMSSRNMTRRSVHLAYLTAKRTNPHLDETGWMALAIIDRAVKKKAALPFNSSPTAWTAEQLQGLIDQAEPLAKTCKSIGHACAIAVQIENDEGTFDDPLGVISRIDAIFSEYGREQDAAVPKSPT